LQFFKNTSTGGSGENPAELNVNLYPNPLFNTSELNIKANQDVTAELISVLGQLIKTPFAVKKYTGTVLDIGNLRNGPYILRTVNDHGASLSQLFLIHR